MPILRKELFLIAELWNTHNIQSQPRQEVDSGKPDVLFFMPEIYHKKNYLIPVNAHDVDICRETYTEKCNDFNVEVEELVRLLVPDFVPPSDTSEALKLFSDIAQIVNNH